MKEPVLPLEGDLLFEEKAFFGFEPKYILFFLTIIISLIFLIISFSLAFIEEPDIVIGSIIVLFIIGFIYTLYITIPAYFYNIKDVFKNGLNNETYKGYYFKDKIIFYRISKYVDEIYTQKLSKEQIENKIKETKVDIESMEKLLAETKKEFSIEIYFKKKDLENLEKGLGLIETGLGKPHRYEKPFSEIKYFINEENTIKLVNKDDANENNLNWFYTNLTLSNKYIEHQATIVEFLNQRVAEAVVCEDSLSVN
jgi:hypothetical protein